MAGYSVFVIIAIFVLDIVAFGLSLAAESRRTKGVEMQDGEDKWCQYSTDIATGFGAGAFLFLFAGHVLVSSITRCLCCGGSLKPGGSRTCAVILCLFTWIFFIIAGICQIVGAAHNAVVYNYKTYLGVDEYTCASLRKGIFAAGAAFTFFHFIFGIGYYLFYVKAEDSSWKNFRGGEAGVGMTQYS